MSDARRVSTYIETSGRCEEYIDDSPHGTHALIPWEEYAAKDAVVEAELERLKDEVQRTQDECSCHGIELHAQLAAKDAVVEAAFRKGYEYGYLDGDLPQQCPETTWELVKEELGRADALRAMDQPCKTWRIYPCADCGKMRSKAEGGTTFTFCDECWDKHYGEDKPCETCGGSGQLPTIKDWLDCPDCNGRGWVLAGEVE